MYQGAHVLPLFPHEIEFFLTDLKKSGTGGINRIQDNNMLIINTIGTYTRQGHITY